jgi:flagellar biosynthesis protein FlhA
VGIAVVLAVMMFIIPMPTVLLDTFMALNLVLSLLVLLTALYIRKITDFSVFPQLLMGLTIFGLAVNVSSTRLILTQGARFNGRMVRSFATFVTGSGNTAGLVVGFIILIVFIVVQKIVITKGATRIAEVAARFSLDDMSNRMMAVESEVSAGNIDEKEAMRRREEIQLESNLYGAMDGSAKFVSGNVTASIFITVVNIIGGIITGYAINHEPANTLLSTYISFAIGDGLVSQIPALLISTATGFIVSHSASQGTFGSDVAKQFGQDARIYFIGGAVLAVLGLIPGFPWYVLIPLAALLFFAGWRIARNAKAQASFAGAMAGGAAKAAGKARPAEELPPVAPLYPLSLELGYGLIPLVDKDKGAELLERVQRVRREMGVKLGIVIPKVRIQDNMRLDPVEYSIKIKGQEIARGKLRMGAYLCMNTGDISEEIEGEKTRDPTFGLPAIWVGESKKEQAERAGYTVVDPPSVIATHLTNIIEHHASEILGRQETQAIIEQLRKEKQDAVADEVMKVLSLGQIEKVLQALLAEQVSIRNVVTIMETLADYGGATKNTQVLSEKVRQALGRQLCLQYADEQRTLHVLTLEQSLEQKIIDSRTETASGVICALEPQVRSTFLSSLSRMTQAVQQRGWVPVVLASGEVSRYLIKNATSREMPDLAVLDVQEMVNDVKIEVVGEVKLQ